MIYRELSIKYQLVLSYKLSITMGLESISLREGGYTIVALATDCVIVPQARSGEIWTLIFGIWR